MAHFDELSEKQEQLILALLREKTKVAAARCADVPPRTMNRWLKTPAFRSAYQETRRGVVDEAFTSLERIAVKAVDALEGELTAEVGSTTKIAAARAVLEFTFKSREFISMEDKMAEMEERLSQLMMVQHPTPPEPPAPPETDQQKANRLRREWLREMSLTEEAIEASLKYDRPQSVAEEQYLLDAVRKTMAFEKSS